MKRRALLASLVLGPTLSQLPLASADGPAAPPTGSDDPLLAFSPSGKYLLCAGSKGPASVLRVQGRLGETSAVATSVSSLARWQPDQDLLAVPEGSRVLLVDFRLSPAKVVAEIPCPAAVSALEWSAAGDRLALGLESGIVEIRSAQNGASLASADLSGRNEVTDQNYPQDYWAVHRVCWSPRGNTIATWNSELRIFTLPNLDLQLRRALRTNYRYDLQWPSNECLLFHSGVYHFSAYRTFTRPDWKQHRPYIRLHPGSYIVACALAVDRRHSRVMVGYPDVGTWILSGPGLMETRPAIEMPGGVTALAWDPDGRRIAIAGSKLTETGRRGESGVWLWRDGDGPSDLTALQQVEKVIDTLSWHPDGRKLVGITSEAELYFWETRTRKLLQSSTLSDLSKDRPHQAERELDAPLKKGQGPSLNRRRGLSPHE